MCFKYTLNTHINICVYSVLNTLLEYTNFHKSKNITLYTFLLVYKIVENLQYIQCILDFLTW